MEDIIRDLRTWTHAEWLTDTYIVTMAMLGSIVIYGYGNMPYIDALFFASGSATQSGLNPYVNI